MPQSKVLTLRLDPQLARRLDKLAEATERSRSYLIAEAVQEYVKLNEWQIKEIKKAVAEADRGEFASDEEVQRVVRKWKRRAS